MNSDFFIVLRIKNAVKLGGWTHYRYHSHLTTNFPTTFLKIDKEEDLYSENSLWIPSELHELWYSYLIWIGNKIGKTKFILIYVDIIWSKKK